MLKSEINKGNVRKNEIQLKKHRMQMNEKELKRLTQVFSQLNKSKTTISKHLLNKESITWDRYDIISILHSDIYDMIIEYNQTPTKWGVIDHRIVIRDRKVVETDHGKANLCIVVSLVENRVLTAYYNLINDNHKTIDWNRYCQYLKVSI